MEIPQRLLCLLVILLSSCAGLNTNNAINHRDDAYTLGKIHNQELLDVKIPVSKPVVAVYASSFIDQTGQRKSNSSFALFSTAVTQAPSALLISILKKLRKKRYLRIKQKASLNNSN